MSSYKRLIEDCRTKRHLIERLQQQDLQDDNIVTEDDEYDTGADSRQLADHLVGSDN